MCVYPGRAPNEWHGILGCGGLRSSDVPPCIGHQPGTPPNCWYIRLSHEDADFYTVLQVLHCDASALFSLQLSFNLH